MKSFALVCCLVVGALAAPTEVGHQRTCQCDYPGGSRDSAADMEQSHVLDELTSHLVKLQKDFERGMGRVDGVLEDMEDLSHRIAQEEDNHCKQYKEFQCGGDHPKCISSLLVCDGSNDCYDGHDEANCEVLMEAGSRWTGTVVYDHCTSRRPQVMKLTVDSVSTPSFFTASPSVTAHMRMEINRKDYSEVVSEPMTGYWSQAGRSVALFPDQAQNLGFVCIFHGHDHDSCTGLLTRKTVRDACAEFTFHRD